MGFAITMLKCGSAYHLWITEQFQKHCAILLKDGASLSHPDCHKSFGGQSEQPGGRPC